jgi:hypothetical protein
VESHQRANDANDANDANVRPLSRRRAVTTALSAAGIAVIGVTSARAQGATPVTSDEAAYLFVQAGFGSGTLAANPDGSYQLILLNAPAQTVFFADRPERIAGTISTARFLEVLGFDESDPPNAALVIQVDDEQTEVVVFALTASTYDAATDSLTYTATLLEGFDQFVETAVGFVEEPLAAGALPTEFGPSSLFIDDIHWNPGGF